MGQVKTTYRPLQELPTAVGKIITTRAKWLKLTGISSRAAVHDVVCKRARYH